VEHDYLPWEKRCHALANVLDMHKIISTEEKRCCVESLGAGVEGKLGVRRSGGNQAARNRAFGISIPKSRNKSLRPKSWRARWIR
jgi:hypothetical protein